MVNSITSSLIDNMTTVINNMKESTESAGNNPTGISEVQNTTAAGAPTSKLSTQEIDETPPVIPAQSEETPELEQGGEVTQSTVKTVASVCLPSFAAEVLAAIQESTSEMIRDNRMISYEAKMESADSLVDQAEQMRKQANYILCFGIASGALSIAGSLASISVSAVSMGNYASLGKSNEWLGSMNSIAGSTEKLASSTGSMIDSIGSFYQKGCEATISELQAEAERKDALAEQIDSINSSLQETVQKAIDTLSSITQSMNEARKYILT